MIYVVIRNGIAKWLRYLFEHVPDHNQMFIDWDEGVRL